MAFKDLLATLRGEGDYANFAQTRHFDLISFPWETLEQIENGEMVPSPAFAELLRDEISYKKEGIGERVYRSAMASYEARGDTPVLDFGEEHLAEFRTENFRRMLGQLMSGNHMQFARNHHLSELEGFRWTELWMVQKGKMAPSPAFAEFLRDDIRYVNPGHAGRFYQSAMSAYEHRGDTPVMAFDDDMLAELRRRAPIREPDPVAKAPAGRVRTADGAVERERRRLERLQTQEAKIAQRRAATIAKETDSTWSEREKEDARVRQVGEKAIWHQRDTEAKAEARAAERDKNTEVRAYGLALDAEETGLQDWIRRDNALTGMARSTTLGEFYEYFDAFSDRPITSFAQQTSDRGALRTGDLPSMETLDVIGRHLREHQHREAVLLNFYTLCSNAIMGQRDQQRAELAKGLEKAQKSQQLRAWEAYEEARDRGIVPGDRAQAEADSATRDDNARLDRQEAAFQLWLRRDNAFTQMMESETLQEFYAGLGLLYGQPLTEFAQSSWEMDAIAEGRPVSRTTMRNINRYLEKEEAHFFVTRNFARLWGEAQKEVASGEQEAAVASRPAARPPTTGRPRGVSAGGGPGRARPAPVSPSPPPSPPEPPVPEVLRASLMSSASVRDFLVTLRSAYTGRHGELYGGVGISSSSYYIWTTRGGLPSASNIAGFQGLLLGATGSDDAYQHLAALRQQQATQARTTAEAGRRAQRQDTDARVLILETQALDTFLTLLPALTGLTHKALGKELGVGGGFKALTERADMQYDTQRRIQKYLRQRYGSDIAEHFERLYKYPPMPDRFADDIIATTTVSGFLTVLGDAYPRNLSVFYDVSGISKASFYNWTRGGQLPPRDRMESLSTCLRELTGADTAYQHLERVWDVEHEAQVAQAEAQKTAEQTAATAALDKGGFPTFGDLLRLLREERGLNQIEAGVAMGVANSIVSSRENGSNAPVTPKTEDEYVQLSPGREALIRAQFAAERTRRQQLEQASGEGGAKKAVAVATSVRVLTPEHATTRIEAGRDAEGGYSTFGDLLGLARLEAKMTQKALGEAVRRHIADSGGDATVTTQARLSDIERGKGRALPSEMEGICAALPGRATELREAFEAVQAGQEHAPRVIARRMPAAQATAEIDGALESGQVPDVHRLLYLLRMEKGMGVRALRKELDGATGEESLTANERSRMPSRAEVEEWRGILPADRYALLEASHEAAAGRSGEGWVGRTDRGRSGGAGAGRDGVG